MSRSSVYVQVLLFSTVIGALAYGGLYLTGHAFDWRFGLLLGYFTGVTALLLAWQESSAGTANIFIRRFMAGLVMKLMGSLILLAVLLKTAPKELTAPLAVVFSLMYLGYLGFSVVRLSGAVKATRQTP